MSNSGSARTQTHPEYMACALQPAGCRLNQAANQTTVFQSGAQGERSRQAVSCLRSKKWPGCYTSPFRGFTVARARDHWSDCRATVLRNTGASEKRKCWRGSSLKAESIMPLDMRTTLEGDIGKGGRANHSKERTRMARCQYQNGCLFIRVKRRKASDARWREDVMLAAGSAYRVIRSILVGPVRQ